MAASFFEVFPVLKLNRVMTDLLEEAIVEKVAASQAKNRIRVYLCSPRLIAYSDIRNLERQIKDQLFENTEVSVDVVDRYTLSEQYTPERLMSIYFESFEAELKASSDLEANIFRKAKKEFTDPNRMILTVEDNFITSTKIESIRDRLLEIFQNRFGYYVDISIEYEETKKSRQAEYAEETFQREVETIVQTYKEVKAANKEKEEKALEQAKPAKEFNKENTYVKKKLVDPDIFYGRPFEGDETPISEIVDEIGEVIVRGKIIQVETREIRNEKSIIMFAVTDFTDTIMAKVFTKNEFLPELLGNLKKDTYIRMKAMAVMDKFDHGVALNSVTGIKKIPDFTTKRMDNSPVKRVELHAHTTMSDMDSVADCKKLLKTAMSWGHTAMAITDHGVVQAFTDANHAVEKTDFKPIYGVEGYLVDDLKPIVFDSKNQSLDSKFVVFDIETTGFSAVNDRIIEIGAVKVEGGQIVERYSTFVNPERPIPFEIEKLTGINDSMVVGAEVIENVLPEFLAFSEDCMMVAHNAEFDMSFIRENCRRLGYEREFTVVDTLAMARSLLPDLKNYKLDTVVEAVGGNLENHHRAVEDAESTADIFVKFVARLKAMGVVDLDTLNAMSQMSNNAIKKLKTYHVIILAANDVGRINLYRLVSWSHLDYYNRRPRIPKSVLSKYREGLIIGSACEAGELYQAVLNGRPEDEIARIVNFYDYLEIQPLGNNNFMIESEKVPQIQSKEDLMEMNRKIVRLGEQFNKPVCATCDVHFINPEDEVYRRIIMTGKGFDDADNQPPLYLRTTEEMLDEFMYLGAEKAEEVVITNTNYIADQIERISPVRPDKCPPVIPDSDKTLRTICYNKAHELYGENLPYVVVERLERELNSIIGNGFAVMYIIAQKLVWKSVADGYLVGSRGSVGSSFAAFTAGITEVNSLQAHYLCPNCKYVDFDSDYVKSFSGRSGCDMEDKNCPVCGHPLSKEGHDIPFETFLGFKGDKEPDIDLNFSGEYQSKAHDYTEVIFGKGQTFRAGTIGTLAEKTAFGYARGYFEDHQMVKRTCELTRLASGCVGVRRTTGQHPGGIIVVPLGEEIYSFTPVQHPANDQTTRTITTHFDYHSIDHNLLKLDILGHDDPTMIRMLQDITGVDPTTIRLDDPDVLSLFHGLEALKIKPEDIGGTDLGSLGIPEFGTEFVMQMLRDTQPKAFSDLVRISGLSHGTDVWLNNAQTLIKEGKAEISTAICTRDDIMIYLINKGVESEMSFKIMESVRKGKGLTQAWEEEMTKHDVPDWYIWSCKKIKYMFPKAHAVAYVMMGIRIAWFKIHYPLAYYAAFFTIRATAFDYELMCQGKEHLEKNLKLYKSNPNPTAKEKDTIRDMKIVQEFYARGFDFLTIDIYKSDAVKFTIVGDKLLPPFSCIDGMGGIAAEALYLAAKGEPFMSKDDIAQRAKVSRSTLDVMGELGILGDLPESNQLSIFDLNIG